MSYLEVNKRWKDQIRLRQNDEAIYLPHGGFCDACATSSGSLTRRSTSTGRVRIIQDESVTHVNRDSKTVSTESGRKMRYDKLVITVGPWTNAVLKSMVPNVELMPIGRLGGANARRFR